MAMMGSGRRGLMPDEIPPIAYLILALVILICLAAVLINYLQKDREGPGVMDAYQKIITSRSRSRA